MGRGYTWGSAGPQGPQGETGPQGPPGLIGGTGPAGQGWDLVLDSLVPSAPWAYDTWTTLGLGESEPGVPRTEIPLNASQSVALAGMLSVTRFEGEPLGTAIAFFTTTARRVGNAAPVVATPFFGASGDIRQAAFRFHPSSTGVQLQFLHRTRDGASPSAISGEYGIRLVAFYVRGPSPL